MCYYITLRWSALARHPAEGLAMLPAPAAPVCHANHTRSVPRVTPGLLCKVSSPLPFIPAASPRGIPWVESCSFTDVFVKGITDMLSITSCICLLFNFSPLKTIEHSACGLSQSESCWWTAVVQFTFCLWSVFPVDGNCVLKYGQVHGVPVSWISWWCLPLAMSTNLLRL